MANQFGSRPTVGLPMLNLKGAQSGPYGDRAIGSLQLISPYESEGATRLNKCPQEEAVGIIADVSAQPIELLHHPWPDPCDSIPVTRSTHVE